MERTAKEVVELRDKCNKMASKLADLLLTVHRNIDGAVVLFGINATNLEDIFIQASKLLYDNAKMLDKKLTNTMIEL